MAGSFGGVRHLQLPTQGAIRLDDCKRQQDDRWCRHERPFSHHSRLARPHREMLTQNATSPSKSIVATGYMMDRVKP